MGTRTDGHPVLRHALRSRRLPLGTCGVVGTCLHRRRRSPTRCRGVLVSCGLLHTLRRGLHRLEPPATPAGECRIREQQVRREEWHCGQHQTAFHQPHGRQDGGLPGYYLSDVEPRGIGDGILHAAYLRDRRWPQQRSCQYAQCHQLGIRGRHHVYHLVLRR